MTNWEERVNRELTILREEAEQTRDRDELLRRLSDSVHNTFDMLKEAEREYLLRLEEQHLAKEKLARAIDQAYDDGDVVGKNEREREAHLRRLLPDLHNNTALADALVRGAERVYRELQRDAERLVLQVTIAKLTNDIHHGPGHTLPTIFVPTLAGPEKFKEA